MTVENIQSSTDSVPEKLLRFFEKHSIFEIGAITNAIAGSTMFISVKDALMNENYYSALGYGLATIGLFALAYKNVQMGYGLRMEDILWYENENGVRKYYDQSDILPPKNR